MMCSLAPLRLDRDGETKGREQGKMVARRGIGLAWLFIQGGFDRTGSILTKGLLRNVAQIPCAECQASEGA